MFLPIPKTFRVGFYSENDGSKLAYVTFKDLQGAETAVLLTVRKFTFS